MYAKPPLPTPGIIATAHISPCARYRYRLGRRWGKGAPLLFIMLNPSTANAYIDDPTIRRCKGFANSHGFNAIDVVNLYSFRTPSPDELMLVHAHYRNGPESDQHIIEALDTAGLVCCAWGSRVHQIDRMGLGRVGQILDWIRVAKKPPHALGFDKQGTPRHPLMLPKECKLVEWSINVAR